MSFFALFTAGKLLEYVIGGIVGHEATTLIRKGRKGIWKLLTGDSVKANTKELLRVARVSLLRASLDACRKCKEEAAPLSKSRKDADKIARHLNKEIKAARSGDWFPTHALDESYKELVRSAHSDQTHDTRKLTKFLKQALVDELRNYRLFPNSTFEKFIDEGWKEKGKEVTWLQKMASDFHEELQKNSTAQSTFQTQVLFEIDNKLINLSDLNKSIKQDTQEIVKTLRQHSSTQLNHELTLPPANPDVFLGRKEELRTLRNLLIANPKDQNPVLVSGNAGIGKSSLVAKYYHQSMDIYDHLAWVSATSGITEALLTMKDGLALNFEKETEDEKGHLILLKLTQLPGLKLLVLDNANNIDDIREHYDQLRSISNLHLIITSWVPKFRKSIPLTVRGLSEDDCVELFKIHYPDLKTDEGELVLSIRKAVDQNTLVLELMAKNLSKVNDYGQKYSLKGLLAELQKKGLFQLSHSKAVDTNYKRLKKARPEEVITAMYDLSGLPQDQQALLSSIALLPNESIPFVYLKLILEWLEDFEESIGTLSENGWIEHDREANTFKWSPIIQEIVRARSTSISDVADSLVTSLADLLHNQAIHIDNYIHAGHFVRYAEKVLSHLNPQQYDSAELWQNIGIYYEVTGELVSALKAFEQMEIILKASLESDPSNHGVKNGLAISYSKLGDTHSAMGNLPKALEYFEKRSALGKELYEAYSDNVSFKHGLAISYEKLGDTHSAMGNLSKALGYFEKRSALGKELYEAYSDNVSFKNGLAISYERLGDTHSAIGNLPKALEYFDEETTLFEELYEAYSDNVSFKNGLAISYSKLGDTHSAIGNLPKALEYFDEETTLFEELYEAYSDNVSFKNGLAISYEKLGDTHSVIGNLPKALEYFEKRSALAKELYEAYSDNVSFKNGLAISYSKLGDTHSAMGNLSKALGYFEKRSALGKELYEAYSDNVSFKNGLAISYEKLGDTHSVIGNLPKALEYFDEETTLFEELYEAYSDNVSFKNGLAISYSKLGDTHSAMGNLPKALEYFEKRSALGKELYEAYSDNVSFKNGLAISYEKLGDTHSAIGNLPKALGYFEKRSALAKELYEAYSDNVSFKNGLAISYSRLGDTHSVIGNLPKALEYFENYLQLTKELYEAYSNNVSFKNGLAISYERLGDTHSVIGNLPKALEYFEKRSALAKELYEAYSDNVSFKNGLAISYAKLAVFYRDKVENRPEAYQYFRKAETLWQELVKQAPQYAEFQKYLSIVIQDLKNLDC